MTRGHAFSQRETRLIARISTRGLLSLVSCGLLVPLLGLTGCDSGSAATNEAMARRQWEMSIQQNRREMEKQGMAASTRSELAAKDREIVRLQKELEELRERIMRLESDAAHDGLVFSVSLTEGTVWIDRGESDGVEVKQLYQVLSGTPASETRQTKSDIVVIRILGPHLSEARILDPKARTIAVGDRLHAHNSKTASNIPKVNVEEGEVLSYEVELEMVEISLGTRAGLVKGERLHVYREGVSREYLGQIQVLNAALNKSYAQIVGGSKQAADLAPGDRVCKKLPEGLVPTSKARVE